MVFYDTHWAQLECFVSTSETVFEAKMLSKFDAELLLGQMSYKQEADIYNYSNKYEVESKRCSAEELPKPRGRYVFSIHMAWPI